jgi:PQQ-dependent catabolism-associated beta-propeller protein
MRSSSRASRSLAGCTLATAAAAALLLPCGAAVAQTAYVSDEEADVLHVIVAPHWEVAARIPVGQRPRGMRLAPGGKLLYVAVSDDNRIDVVDLGSRKVIGHLPSGPDPERFAVSPDGRFLYVANEADNRVSFVDIGAGKIVREVEVGAEPEGMAVSPDGRWVICTSESASLVHFIDARTGELVDSVMVGTRPRDAVFNADGSRLWVSSETRATVSVFEMPSRRLLHTIDFDRDPDAPDTVQAVEMILGKRAFVALGRGNAVAEVDPRDYSVSRYFPAGFRNWGIGADPARRYLFAAAGLSGDVTVIDLGSNKPVATIRTGGKPWGVVVAP